MPRKHPRICLKCFTTICFWKDKRKNNRGENCHCITDESVLFSQCITHATRMTVISAVCPAGWEPRAYLIGALCLEMTRLSSRENMAWLWDPSPWESLAVRGVPEGQRQQSTGTLQSPDTPHYRETWLREHAHTHLTITPSGMQQHLSL